MSYVTNVRTQIMSKLDVYYHVLNVLVVLLRSVTPMMPMMYLTVKVTSLVHCATKKNKNYTCVHVTSSDKQGMSPKGSCYF